MREYTVTIERHDGVHVDRHVYAKDRNDAMAFAKNIFRHHCKKIAKCHLNKPPKETAHEELTQSHDRA